MIIDKIISKVGLYGQEALLCGRLPHSFAEKMQLLFETLNFHIKNGASQTFSTDKTSTMNINIGRDTVQNITYLPYNGDLAILHEIFARDVYVIDDATLPPDGVKVIVDAGANIGFAALFFAAKYPNARIFSIEPNPRNFERLVKNTARIAAITPVHACLTGLSGADVFIETEGRGSHFQMNRAGVGAKIRAMTIAELMRDNGMEKIDLLKMDIEGGEIEIFGHAEFVEHVGVVVAELHGDYGQAEFNRDLHPYGLQAAPSRHAKDSDIFLATRRG